MSSDSPASTWGRGPTSVTSSPSSVRAAITAKSSPDHRTAITSTLSSSTISEPSPRARQTRPPSAQILQQRPRPPERRLHAGPDQQREGDRADADLAAEREASG